MPDNHGPREPRTPQPDSQTHDNGEDLHSGHLGLAEAVQLAEIVAPDFILVSGCVLRRTQYDPANLEEWQSVAGGDIPQIEYLVNHLHLWDYLAPSNEAEERALERLAGKIAISWELHARRQFPERRFVAEVTNDYGPTVAVFQGETPPL